MLLCWGGIATLLALEVEVLTSGLRLGIVLQQEKLPTHVDAEQTVTVDTEYGAYPIRYHPCPNRQISETTDCSKAALSTDARCAP